MNKIYSRIPIKTPMVILITLGFFCIGFIGILNHELWLDEAHHYLLGRDSSSLIDLYHNTRYDGHPILWNYLIHLITRFTYEPFFVQLFHVLISSIVVIVFLKKAPFKLWFKLAFILGFFMLYEYTVISRNYNLGLLFIFLACSFYEERRKNFTLICFILALCCNTHAIFIIVSLALMATLILEQLLQKQFLINLKNYWKGYLVFALGLILAMFQILPKGDTIFFDRIDHSSTFEILKSGMALFKALFPLVDFTEIRYSNRFYLLENHRLISLFLAALVWLVPLFLFNRKRLILFFVSCSLFGYVVFENITQLFAVRYNGILFIAIITGLWLAKYHEEHLLFKRDLSRYNLKIIVSLLIIQVISGITAYSLDLKRVYNHGKTVANYIESEEIPLELIQTHAESASINAYLGQNLYNICYKRPQGYFMWNVDCTLVIEQSNTELVEYAFENNPQENLVFLILAEPLDVMVQLRLDHYTYKTELVKEFTGAVKKGYYLYRIEKFETK